MPRISRKGGSKAANLIIASKERIWNCAVYARLSLEDSGRKGADTIETQIELVSSYASQRLYLKIADTYVDNGASGKDFDRPAWTRLMDDVRAGRIDCICVKDLSRFSRNYIETCEFLEKIFPFMGVRFVSVNDGYDSGTPTGKNEGLIVALKSLVHDQYLKDISRKVASSCKARRERGQYSGREPFGYLKSKTVKGKLEPDPDTAPIVRDIFRWRAEGMSQGAICKKLEANGIPCPSVRLKTMGKGAYNGYAADMADIQAVEPYLASTADDKQCPVDIWQPRAIKRMIRNPIYLGHLAFGKTHQSLAGHKPLTILPRSEWEIKENTHEALVSQDLWDAANAVEAERRVQYYESREFAILPDNIFRGYLVCGFCGSKLIRAHNARVNSSGKRYEYFHFFCAVDRIHSESDKPLYKRVRLEFLYDLALPLIAERLKSAANLGAIIAKRAKREINPRAVLDAEITRVSRELETINRRLAGLYENYVDKLLTKMQYVDMRDIYEARAVALRKNIDDLSSRASVVEDVSVSNNRWLKAARDFQNPVELTREMLEAIVDRIEVFGSKGIEVKWKFSDEYALLEACVNAEGKGVNVVSDVTVTSSASVISTATASENAISKGTDTTKERRGA